jgi:hypothetical protein
MDELSRIEYQTLRQTISLRGTARSTLFLAGTGLWAGALLAVLVVFPNPIASAIPLLVLMATFEALRALHTGVERIGRYIQVFFESLSDEGPAVPPAWEHAAMRLGGRVLGAGGHPLFLPVFLLATAVNLLAVILPDPLPVELATLGVVHAAFVAWMIYVDRGVRVQREQELEMFLALRNRGREM